MKVLLLHCLLLVTHTVLELKVISRVLGKQKWIDKVSIFYMRMGQQIKVLTLTPGENNILYTTLIRPQERPYKKLYIQT